MVDVSSAINHETIRARIRQQKTSSKEGYEKLDKERIEEMTRADELAEAFRARRVRGCHLI